MGWSPIRNIVGAVKDVGSAIDDAVISKVVDPVVTMGEQFEDLTREGIEGIDEAIQNPYVRMVVGAVIPGSKPWIDAYAKLDSGEELGTADYVSLGLSGAEDFANAEIPEEVKIGLKVGTRINAGEDPVDILVDEYGDDYIADLELDVKLDDTIRSYYGDDVADLLKDNKNVIDLANEIVVKGTDPSAAIADIYGQEIVDYLGAGDPTGYAALKTAVGLDQGLTFNDAVLAGGEEYYKRGGELPNINELGRLVGVEDVNINLNDFVADLGLDFPDLKGKYDLPSLASMGIDLNQFNITAPDIFDTGLELPQIADLGLDLGKVDFSGVDIGEFGIGMDGFDVSELEGLADMGVDVGSLDVGRLDLPKVAAKMALAQEVIPGTMVTSDGEEIASLAPDLDFLNEGEPTLARKLLDRTFA